MNNFEQKEGLNHHDKASCHLLQCQIFFWQGKLKELIKHTEPMYKESRERENNLFIVDNLLIMTHTLVRLNKFDKAFYLIKHGEELIKTIPHELKRAYKQREAYLAFIKGYFYNYRRDPDDADLALKHLEHSLVMREELGIRHEISESLDQMAWNLLIFKGEMDRALKYSERSVSLARESRKKYYIASSFQVMALITSSLGEADRSIKTNEQGLELFKELDNKYGMADILNNLSIDYKNNGDLDRALECIEQAMGLNRGLGALRNLANNHDFLIQILIERGYLERAQQSLNNLERLNSQLKNKEMDLMHLLDKALLLKTSLRARDRGKAEEILIQLLENENLTHDVRYTALINLCELLLTELRMTNDLIVLDELNQFLGQLLELAEKSHSYWLIGETYLLQAKLALLSLDLKEARRLFTQGQQIAERYGIKLLVIKISNEHDELLKQLEIWENLKESKASLAERIELSRLNEQMERMVKKRLVKSPKLEAEQPVLLTVMSKDGKILLSNPFTADLTIDSTYFSEFLSSCNTFCDQILSESFDRVKFGQHTVLITPVDSFSICYIFQGQSYSARQKLIHFSETVRKDPNIMKILKDAGKKNIEIKVNETASLEELISESFLSDPQQFQMPFKAYKGEEPFVFVSYSHTDRLQVYPIIDYLNKNGINIWYDEGIPISENWKKSIVQNLERSRVFLVFITPQIIVSEMVRKEISFALKKKKKFIAIYLKETNLPSELEFEISDIQALMKYRLIENEFYSKLKDTFTLIFSE